MNNEPDYGWKTVLLTAEGLMAAAVAGGLAILLALVLGPV